jgi:hypothetical protein
MLLSAKRSLFRTSSQLGALLGWTQTDVFKASRFTQPQIAAIDWHFRQRAPLFGLDPRDVELTDDNGHPAWRRGSRKIRLERPTTTQATMYVLDRGEPICNPQPGLMQRLEWPAERMVRAFLYEEESQ